MHETLSPVSALDRASAESGFSLSAQPSRTRKVQSDTNINKLASEDRAFHDWYRFVLSFPPHLVRQYLLERFSLSQGATVLDPFCGTGTTVVEAKINGISAIGIEANAVAHLASRTKSCWTVDLDSLEKVAEKVAILSKKVIEKESEVRLRDLDDEQKGLLLTGSISPVPLHKSLVLAEIIGRESEGDDLGSYFRLALAKTLVFSASNLHFGPEVGVRGKKSDAPVVEAWLQNIRLIVDDLSRVSGLTHATTEVIKADSREMSSYLAPKSVDAVFTSPPYPNEKDYTRTTRLESVLLGYINNKDELRAIKKSLLRSNTRGVYKGDADDFWIKDNEKVNAIAAEIERRRIELGKNSGFEKLYGRVTKLYFGGMAKHLAELRPHLSKGAMLGYVVGDQASYLQVMIRTGEVIAEIAQDLGYEVVGIDLFRTRISTVTKAYMREEVVVLKWNK